jgi:putative redox protein
VADKGETTMRVQLDLVGPAAFEATAGSGGSLVVDGAPDIGGEGRGMRPMELLLASVASCSAMDVLHILRKQKERLEGLSVTIEGVRPDAVPSPFARMKLVFVARGTDLDAHKVQRAVGLAVEKYCSVSATLDQRVAITWEARVESVSGR